MNQVVDEHKIQYEELAYPRVNINGSSAADLERQYRLVYETLDHAYEVMAANPPHGRDYQTAPRGEYDKAAKEHADRMKRLLAIGTEVMSIRMQLHNQRRQERK